MESDFLSGILAAAAMKEAEDTFDAKEKEKELIELLTSRDWRLLEAYMRQGFSREEAFALLLALHN